MKNKKTCCPNILKVGAVITAIASVALVIKKALGLKEEKAKTKKK